MRTIDELLACYDQLNDARHELEARRDDPDAEFDVDEIGELGVATEDLLHELVSAVRAGQTRPGN